MDNTYDINTNKEQLKLYKQQQEAEELQKKILEITTPSLYDEEETRRRDELQKKGKIETKSLMLIDELSTLAMLMENNFPQCNFKNTIILSQVPESKLKLINEEYFYRDKNNKDKVCPKLTTDEITVTVGKIKFVFLNSDKIEITKTDPTK